MLCIFYLENRNIFYILKKQVNTNLYDFRQHNDILPQKNALTCMDVQVYHEQGRAATTNPLSSE